MVIYDSEYKIYENDENILFPFTFDMRTVGPCIQIHVLGLRRFVDNQSNTNNKLASYIRMNTFNMLIRQFNNDIYFNILLTDSKINRY